MRRSAGLGAVAVVVAALIVTAVVALTTLDGGDRSSPAAGPATSAPAAPESAAPRVTAAPAPSSSPVAQNSPRTATPAARKAVTYRVKRGDNLTVIAAWFKLHGYGDLYERNKDVIGADPNLIRPGQKITVSPAGVTTTR